MLINLTAISTGFWIREDRKRKGKERSRLECTRHQLTPGVAGHGGGSWLRAAAARKRKGATSHSVLQERCRSIGCSDRRDSPREGRPSRPHSLSQLSAMLPLTSRHEVNQAPISTDPAGLKPFLSRATAFHVSSLAKKHANCSAPDKIRKRGEEVIYYKELNGGGGQGAACTPLLSPQSLPLARAVWKRGEWKPFLKAVSDENTVSVRGTGTNRGEKPIADKLEWFEFTKDIWEIKKKSSLKNHELPVQSNNRVIPVPLKTQILVLKSHTFNSCIRLNHILKELEMCKESERREGKVTGKRRERERKTAVFQLLSTPKSVKSHTGDSQFQNRGC